MRTNILLLFVLPIIAFSCKTKSEVIYFKTVGTDNNTEISSEKIISYEPQIIPDDILSITVTATDPAAVAIFNLPTSSFLTPGETQMNVTPSLQTYLVDAKGNIDFPVIGKIHVAGLTRGQLANLIKTKIEAYVENPLVTIQVMNFKVVVLGEVNKPGTVKINNERISILDAIGEAGDLTIYGERTNVLIIRENNCKNEFARFDLTQPDIFTSPYYYLQKNDVIYIEPNKARQGNALYSSNKQYNVSVISTVISAVSVIASLCIALFVNR